jgi:hypothetical protein
MSLTKSKCWYSNNCLHFLKCAVPLQKNLKKDSNLDVYKKIVQSNEGKKRNMLNNGLFNKTHCGV